MMSPASRLYRRLPSPRSHSMATPSFPPEAHSEPSGDTVTLFTYPVWPSRFFLSLQLVRLQTLTILSHPPDTMIGFDDAGENLTHDTHSVCPSWSWMVYLHSPR